MEPLFDKWKNMLWRTKKGESVAFCPVHKQRLEIVDKNGKSISQDTSVVSVNHAHLICPVDEKIFPIFGDNFWRMQERYKATKESEMYKNATYRDLDNVYTPILKVEPKPKDKRYSVQVEIDDTPYGKKLVIYAMDRNDPKSKTQIFIDPQIDKISFDGKDLHPNQIFSKVVAYFKGSKKVTLEKDN